MESSWKYKTLWETAPSEYNMFFFFKMQFFTKIIKGFSWEAVYDQWETFWDDRGQQTYRVNPLFSELCACSELRKQWKFTRYVCCHLALESLPLSPNFHRIAIAYVGIHQIISWSWFRYCNWTVLFLNNTPLWVLVRREELLHLCAPMTAFTPKLSGAYDAGVDFTKVVLTLD